MATIRSIRNPWRDKLLPAMFRNCSYHVEQQSRSSGRRIVLHEYPKREGAGYAEDMGRHAIRYQITGYCIGPTYQYDKEQLIAALEKEGPGTLVDPYMPQDFQAVCERYSVVETRERGGYCVFEMVFLEAGSPGNSPMFNDSITTASTDTQGNVNAKADDAGKATAAGLNTATVPLPPQRPAGL